MTRLCCCATPAGWPLIREVTSRGRSGPEREVRRRPVSFVLLVFHLFTCFADVFRRLGMQPGFGRALFQSRVPLLIPGRRRRRRRLCGAPPKAQKPAISQEMRDLLVSACRCGQKGVKIGAAQQQRFPKTPFFFLFFFLCFSSWLRHAELPGRFQLYFYACV